MPRVSWVRAAHQLADLDPRLAALVERVGTPRLRSTGSGPDAVFGALARAIAFQQLAGAAASTIHGRFVEAFDGAPTPDAVLAAPDEQLRGTGLSAAKVAAIRDVARHAVEGRLDLRRLARLDDEAVTAELTSIRGVGPWTAQMFLMFDLRRPDVWPVADLGVRKGFARIFDHEPPPTSVELEPLGDRFRPHRSILAWYCWRALDEPAF